VLPAYDLRTISARLAHTIAAEDSSEPGKRAAVAAVLRDAPDGGGAELLFIRRAERVGDPWSGHVAYPGGRKDVLDSTLLHTAVRETREEVGLDLEAHGELLARLPDVTAVVRGHPLGLVIAHFVFALRGAPDLVPNEEVASLIWTPLATLARGEGAGTMIVEHEGKKHELPCIRLGEHVLWGLTYNMLVTLLATLRESS
jgi:8-oxo-dGTP pyrophosphatase MutT (NUDIX family)